MADGGAAGRGDHVYVRLGHAFALVGPSTRAIVSATNSDLAESLWEIVADGGGADELLERLSATGLKSLGAFAIAEHETDGIRFVVRQAGVVDLVTAEGMVTFEAGDAKTWVESLRSSVSSYRVRLGEPLGDDGTPFRITGGLVPGDLLAWEPEEALRSLAAGDADPFAEFEPPLPLVSEPDDVDDSVGVSLGRDAAVSAAVERKAEGEYDPTEEPVIEPDSGATKLPASGATVYIGSGIPGDDPDEESVQVGESAAEDGVEYDDYVSGLTRTAPASQAGVILDGDGLPTPGSSPDQSRREAPGSPIEPSNAQRPAEPVSLPTEGSAGIIASVPGPSASATQGRESVGGDHDGHTMSLAQLRALRSESLHQVAHQPAMGGATVNALLCSSGHASPPHAVVCRSCGLPVAGDPVVIARPRLGRLSFSTGLVVELDRPVLVGRQPKVEGEVRGAVPHLVALPEHEGISRRHVMVHLEQWQVLIEDLGSQNWTEVVLPGRTPQRLRERVPIPLESGAVVDLSGEVTFQVELI